MTAIAFLRDYFEENEHFIIAQKYPKNKDGKIKHHHTLLNIHTKNLQKQLGRFYYLNKDENVDIYFSLNTYTEQNSRYPSRKEEFVNSIKSFYFDIDKGDIEQKKTDIINLIGVPTYIIESSKNKFQFIYKFKKPLVLTSQEQREEFKKLLKGLCYHFDVDKTFDTARIFRLAGYMNKKASNNNFRVTIKKSPHLYTYTDFEEVARNFLLTEAQPKPSLQKHAKPRQKTTIIKETKITSTTSKFDRYKDIKKVPNRKYKELLKKYEGDKSTADLGFAKWLRTAKQITDEDDIIERIFKARGYDELMQKHGYQIQYYIDNILEKSL